MQKVSINKANDQTYDANTCVIEKTEKNTSVETTQEESTNVSMVMESDTYSPTTKGDIISINLIDTT